MQRSECDEIDIKILKEYLRDARQSFREIAKKLGLSVGTVLKRTKKLEALGIIKGYSVIIDYEKLGYELTAITEVTVSKGKLLEMEAELAKLPHACAVYDVTGLSDAMVIAKFKSRQELSAFTKKILSMPFVERTNTKVVLTIIKEDFRLPLIHE
ncbi:MAG: Lrp/AsnC family transcriptional regulator [Nitrososphaerales archaeon]|nr:Lrp/AsnC family transcriptional regulator [Nitrososphaerales archaeon]